MATGSRFTSQLNISATGSERGQKRGQNKARTRPENRAKTCEDRVSQQGGLSQPTGRLESANRKARVSQPEGASQPTRVARVRQPGRESDNQVTSQTTRPRVRQPARQTTRSRVRHPVASQPTRSRVSQPGRESANQVASQTTGRESAGGFCVAGVGQCALPRGRMYTPLAFAWQAWDNVHCQGVGCTPRCPSGVPWSPPLCR